MVTRQLFWIFLRLGCTSFGGPAAHLAYFRTEFVERRAWLDDATYLRLVALCQFLPGPASSQTGFAIGLMRGGAWGGLAAWAGFTLPSALLMIAAASGVQAFTTGIGAAMASGLKLAAVSIVAHAVFSMARSTVTTPLTIALAVAAGAAVLLMPMVWTLPAAILLAGGGYNLLQRDDRPAPEESGPVASNLRPLIVILIIFATVLIGIPVAVTLTEWPALMLADAMFRAGSFVYGGGHVVLPLMEHEVVGRGWLDADDFLAGYGAAQVLPGPLFTFAAFVGAAATPEPGLAGAVIALVAIFAPGLVLTAAFLPHWEALSARPPALRFVTGASAAVTGILAAALIDPVATSAITGPAPALIAVTGFAALQWTKAPVLLVIAGITAAGAALALGSPH